MDQDPLSFERVQYARETLLAIFWQCPPYGDFPGAVDQADAGYVIIEAQRSLAAFIQHRHGETAFQQMLVEDEGDTEESPADVS